jgi:hypothetical protein
MKRILVVVEDVILCLALHRQRDRAALVFAYVAELIAAPALYMMVPAVGPAATFGASWLHPPSVYPAAMSLNGMPNAFPSLHLATAFVLVLLARKRMWRTVSVVFLAGTAVATITTGEHYVIDLIAGFSFGCFAAAAGCREAGRAGAYLAVTLCWSLAIRFWADVLLLHPRALRLSALLTLAMSIATVWRIWRLSSSAEKSSLSTGVHVGVPLDTVATETSSIT